MRILHLIPQYYPVVGGSERSTRELSIELVKMGHRVSVFTTDALELKGTYNYCSKYITESSSGDSGVKVFRFHVVNSLVHRTLGKIFLQISRHTKGHGIA